jgi:hypothetical protein
MGWIILIAAILVLLAAMIDALDLVYLGMVDFFLNSSWGIITLITGILSLILFYASSKSYKEVKINEIFLLIQKN